MTNKTINTSGLSSDLQNVIDRANALNAFTAAGQDEQPEPRAYDCDATYSPEDDKIRLYFATRIPRDEYDRLKNAGFGWAPKQGCIYAIWSPERERLALEFAEFIDDDDKTIMDRAEQRAYRFDGYQSNRIKDAEQAAATVERIGAGIPLGQPILVGHHSERHARRDAKRIENGMRTAVEMWSRAEYWERRAAAVLAHAKYKETPAVRYRRIKGLEADARKQEANLKESTMWARAWAKCEAEPDAELQHAAAVRIANVCWLHLPAKEGDRPGWSSQPTACDALHGRHPSLYAPRTIAEVFEAARKVYPANIKRAEIWLAHIQNRIRYERAMLGEAGGLVAEKVELQVGGRVSVKGGQSAVILKVNKSAGQVVSVSVAGLRYQSIVGIEEIEDYTAPTAADVAKVKKATALPPIVNYPGEGFVHMTEAEWKKKTKYTDAPKYRELKATETAGACRVRAVYGSGFRYDLVFLTDSKVKNRPALATEVAEVAEPVAEVATYRAQHVRDLLAEGEGVTEGGSMPEPVAVAETAAAVVEPEPAAPVPMFKPGDKVTSSAL